MRRSWGLCATLKKKEGRRMLTHPPARKTGNHLLSPDQDYHRPYGLNY